MSPPQVHHLYECLCTRTYHTIQPRWTSLPRYRNQTFQSSYTIWMKMKTQYLALPWPTHMKLCSHMTPPEVVWESPQICYIHWSPQEDTPDVPNGIDILYPPDSGKTHLSQVSLWSIMLDRPSYTIHPQPSGVAGSGCMDFSIDRFNRQSPSLRRRTAILHLKVSNLQTT